MTTLERIEQSQGKLLAAINELTDLFTIRKPTTATGISMFEEAKQRNERMVEAILHVPSLSAKLDGIRDGLADEIGQIGIQLASVPNLYTALVDEIRQCFLAGQITKAARPRKRKRKRNPKEPLQAYLDLRMDLAVERVTKKPAEHFVSQWMERGAELEPLARRAALQGSRYGIKSSVTRRANRPEGG